MLVLTRKVGEAIYIDGDIRVVVQSIEGKTVRLGIEAPRDIQVLRDELRRRGNGRSRRSKANSTNRSQQSKQGR